MFTQSIIPAAHPKRGRRDTEHCGTVTTSCIVHTNDTHTHTHSGGPGPPMHYSYIICKRVCTLLAQCRLGSSMSGGDFATQYHTHFPLSADRDRAARGPAIETHFTRFAVEHNDRPSCRSSEYAGYLNASRVIGDIASLRS